MIPEEVIKLVEKYELDPTKKIGSDNRYHILYCTYNIINNRYYIGKHSTRGPNLDTYSGSGEILKEAIRKYGIEAFITEPLQFYDTSDLAFDGERLVVTEELIKSELCYNITLGGYGANFSGMSWYYNPSTGARRQFFDGTEEEGFIKGRPDTPFAGSNKGQRTIHRSDGTEIFIDKDQPLPDGWYEGQALQDRTKETLNKALDQLKQFGKVYLQQLRPELKPAALNDVKKIIKTLIRRGYLPENLVIERYKPQI